MTKSCGTGGGLLELSTELAPVSRVHPQRKEINMQYDQVIAQVARQGNLPTDRAEALTRATLRVLAVRITGGEAQKLSTQLPADLDAELTEAEEPANALTFAEFQQRVQDELAVDSDGSGDRVRAVFSVLSQAVTSGEFDNVVSHLPREFRTAVDVVE